MKIFTKLQAANGVILLILFLAVWEITYLLQVFPPLLFPSLRSIAKALVQESLSGELLVRTAYSLYIIILGMGISIVVTIALLYVSSFSQAIQKLLKTIIAVVDPLPGIALLPLTILWFGIGEVAIIFVIVHSVLWPVLLSVSTGFRSVPPILVDVGRNIGLDGYRLVTGVLLPASLPHLIMGLRTGWSRAWRALISAEMVFGATGHTGGLGWDIFMKRSFMNTPGLYVSLIVIMIIGFVVEKVLISTIENKTVIKWGMVK